MSEPTIVVVAESEPESTEPVISETDVEQAQEIGHLEAEVENLEDKVDEIAEVIAEAVEEITEAVEEAQATAEIALDVAVSQPNEIVSEPEPEVIVEEVVPSIPEPEMQPRSANHWFTRTWKEWRGIGD